MAVVYHRQSGNATLLGREQIAREACYSNRRASVSLADGAAYLFSISRVAVLNCLKRWQGGSGVRAATQVTTNLDF